MPSNPRTNPYVGPRAFQTGEKLHGRDSELQQLLDLLIAERIVLLYSPSGAGKSSLVQAGLIPCLKEESFRVHPVARVNLAPPPGLQIGPDFNRYVFSALLSLAECLPEDQQIKPEMLAALTLDEYLSQHSGAEGEPDTEVLIFDQFEEILTQDPMDRAGKQAFFAQIGAALRNRPNEFGRKRWALFSMREDYVPSLDPYLRPIPTRLANTFRLDLLGVEAARQAIQNPPREARVEMSAEAAKKLVDDLRRVQVQRPDGKMEEQPGLYVEPVQLQVVCYRLWQNLAPEQDQITEEDLASVGDVDESLAEYYAERVAVVAAQTGVREREIRDWFDHHLITPQGIRGQVVMGEQHSDGLANSAIRLLENAHLVRAEKRRGVTWFELAHDRLLQPVRLNNEAWSQAHLSLLQRQATLWDNQDRFEGLLLRDRDLQEAEAWAAQHPQELTEIDREFLERCQDLRAQEEEARAAAERQLKLEAAEKLAEAERRRAEEQTRHASQLRRRAVYLVVALVIALGMAALAGFFWNQTNLYAETQKKLAVDNANIAATSVLNAGIAQSARGTAVAESNVAATARADAENQRSTAVAEGKRADEARLFAESRRIETDRLRRLGLSNNLALLSAEYLDRQADLALLLGIESYRWNESSWNAISALFGGLGRNISRKAERYGPPPPEIPLQPTGIFDVAFSPNGQLLAWGGVQGVVALWDVQEGKLIRNFSAGGATVYAVSFNHTGSLLAYGSGGKVVVRNTATGRLEKEFTTNYNLIHDLAFSPNGKFLAINGQSRRIDLWDLENWTYSGPLPVQTGIVPCTLAWSPPGNYLAVVCSGSVEKIGIWDPVKKQLERSLDGLEGPVMDLAWSPDGKRLVSAGDDEIGEKDKTLLLWDLATRQFTPLPGHSDRVRAVAFSRDGRVMATGGADRTVILWDTNEYVPVDTLKEYGDQVTSLSFSPQEESLLAVSSLDRSVKLYRIIPRESLYTTLAFGQGQVRGLAFTSETALAVLGSRSGRLAPLNLSIDGNSQPFSSPASGVLYASAALHPEGQRWALGGEAGRVQIGSLETGEISLEFQASDRPIQSLAFHPNGERMAIALCLDEDRTADPCTQNEIRLWDIQLDPPQEIGCLRTGHTDSIRSLAFSPDGNFLASGAEDRNIHLYSGSFEGCPAAPEQTLLATHSGGVTSLAFRLPAGDLLAAGGQDGRLAFWAVGTRQKIGDPILGNGGDLLSLAFSPDGLSLVSGDEDGFVLLWDTDFDSWRARACELAGRNLTQAEWQEYISGGYLKTCGQWPEGQ